MWINTRPGNLFLALCEVIRKPFQMQREPGIRHERTGTQPCFIRVIIIIIISATATTTTITIHLQQRVVMRR